MVELPPAMQSRMDTILTTFCQKTGVAMREAVFFGAEVATLLYEYLAMPMDDEEMARGLTTKLDGDRWAAEQIEMSGVSRWVLKRGEKVMAIVVGPDEAVLAQKLAMGAQTVDLVDTVEAHSADTFFRHLKS